LGGRESTPGFSSQKQNIDISLVGFVVAQSAHVGSLTNKYHCNYSWKMRMNRYAWSAVTYSSNRAKKQSSSSVIAPSTHVQSRFRNVQRSLASRAEPIRLVAQFILFLDISNENYCDVWLPLASAAVRRGIG
jgi:hypothetical protein